MAASMALSELLSVAGRAMDPEVMISGVQIDSRQVRAGDLFMAVPGLRHDGRQFIEQAVANGAVAVVAEPPVAGFVDEISVPLIERAELQQETGVIAAKFFGHPSRALHMVGVTGTNGKTTTCWLTAQLTRLMGKSSGVIGTLGASLGDGIAEAANTTPDAVSLQQQLAKWRDKGVFSVGMEVSSHALVQGRVNGVVFETAVFTNLSRDHLDYHGSMADYGRAKTQLFMTEDLRHAIVNLDDGYAGELLSVIDPATRVLTYSICGAPDADIALSEIRFHRAGVTAQVNSPWGSGTISSPLAGDFNLSNLAAAIAAVALMTSDFTALLAAVSKLKAVPGRMQVIPNELDLQLIVDYAHTPDALQHILQAMRPHVEGRLFTVFGCGGDRDRGKRATMGRIACELSDKCVVTSDNPRSEDPLAIMQDIEAGCAGDYTLVVDRAEAIFLAVTAAEAGDCVVIAGKGHEDYQIVNGERLHFRDEEQVHIALASRAVS